MPLMTATEAGQKQCRIVQPITIMQPASAVATPNGQRGDIGMKFATCRGPGCALWAWHDPAIQEPRRGHCGMVNHPGL
jgi:hypothetical protein